MSESAEESLAPDISLAVGELSLNDVPSAAKEDDTVPVQAGKGEKTKIDILLKATGNAPIIKKKKWLVDPDKTIGSIVDFVKKYLKLDPGEKLFLYVNQTFAPSPDQLVKNLYECFGTDGKLILHYCKTQAWG